MNTNTLTKEKIAIILEPHAHHLAAMKARGKSLSELLYWIRSNHGWVLNPAQLERFLKQKESTTQPQADSPAPPSTQSKSPASLSAEACNAKDDPGRTPATTAELEYQQLLSSAPTTPSSMPCKTPPM